VEKIAYSAFYNTRLEWLLRRLGITRLIVAGIVTNGGVAATVRDAAVRDFHVTLLEDGCAAFDPASHASAIHALRGVCDLSNISSCQKEFPPCV
jgi:nicotinamidase-related amidase